MDRNDFMTWLDDFKAKFPSKAAWMANNVSEATLDAWHDVLKSTDIESALLVNKAILNGEHFFPDAWEMIPAMIVESAEWIEAQAIANRTTPTTQLDDGKSCDACHEGGLVICYAIETVREAVDTGALTLPVKTFGIGCTCAAGRPFCKSSRMTRKGRRAVITVEEAPGYDPRKHCKVAMINHADRILNWLEQRNEVPA